MADEQTTQGPAVDPQAEAWKAIDDNSLVDTYIKARDGKKKIEARQAAELKPTNDLMFKIQVEMHRRLLERKADNSRTPGGVAFLKDFDSITIADWSSALRWIIEGERWGFLDAGMNKTAVKEFMKQQNEIIEEYRKANDGQNPNGVDIVPPGVNYRSGKVCQFRAPKD